MAKSLMASSSNTFSVVFHVLASLIAFTIFSWDIQIVAPGHQTYGGRWKYLTNINTVRRIFYENVKMIKFVFTSMPWEYNDSLSSPKISYFSCQKTHAQTRPNDD